jgi:hypothetical protein
MKKVWIGVDYETVILMVQPKRGRENPGFLGFFSLHDRSEFSFLG